VHVGDQHHAHLALRETLCVIEDIAPDLFRVSLAHRTSDAQRTPRQRRGDGVLQVDLARHGDFLSGADGVEIGQAIQAIDEGRTLDTGGLADAGGQSAGEQLGMIGKFLQGAMGELPGTRARKGHLAASILGRIEIEDQFRLEAQEGDDALVDAVLECPVRPVVKIHVDGEVREAVGQWRGHRIGDATVALAVAGGENRPARRHAVVAEAAVEDQLIGSG